MVASEVGGGTDAGSRGPMVGYGRGNQGEGDAGGAGKEKDVHSCYH
jgi:hypothetical protein